MKHPITEFAKIACCKGYDTVAQIQHDLECQLQLTIEELEQRKKELKKEFTQKQGLLKGAYTHKRIAFIDEILGENNK